MDFNALFDNLGSATLDGLTRGSIYALVALGYTSVSYTHLTLPTNREV